LCFVERLSLRPSGPVSVRVYVLMPFCGGQVNSGGVWSTVAQSAGRTGASVESERTRMS